MEGLRKVWIASGLLLGSFSSTALAESNSGYFYDDFVAAETHSAAYEQNFSDKDIYNNSYAENTFIFNPRTQQWRAISNGKTVRSGHGSAGASYCRDIKRSCRTPSGSFRVISKGGPGCKSSRYPLPNGGAPMPYCMFFSKNYAIHGSGDVPNYNASHGCVRVYTSDARWLNQNFLRNGDRVIIQSY